MIFRPDDFLRDWYGHLTNQGAHGGLVGVGGGLIAFAVMPDLWAWLAVCGLYLAYEALIQSGFDERLEVIWDWRDSLDDLSNVAGGAAVVICALAYGHMAAGAAFAVWAGALAVSTLRRVK